MNGGRKCFCVEVLLKQWFYIHIFSLYILGNRFDFGLQVVLGKTINGSNKKIIAKLHKIIT